MLYRLTVLLPFLLLLSTACTIFGSDDPANDGISEEPEYFTVTPAEYERMKARGELSRYMVVEKSSIGSSSVEEYILYPLPTPDPTETAVKASAVEVMDIWYDYKANETKANHDWKGRTVVIHSLYFDEIEEKGQIIRYPAGLGMDRIVMDLKDDREAFDLRPGTSQPLYLECKVRGLVLDFALTFNNCRLLAIGQ